MTVRDQDVGISRGSCAILHRRRRFGAVLLFTLSALVKVFITDGLANSIKWIPFVNQMSVLYVSPILILGAVLLSIIASMVSLRKYLRT